MFDKIISNVKKTVETVKGGLEKAVNKTFDSIDKLKAEKANKKTQTQPKTISMADNKQVTGIQTEKQIKKPAENVDKVIKPTKTIPTIGAPQTIVKPLEDSSTEKNSAKPHGIQLENQKLLAVTGIVAVPIFTDKNICAELPDQTLNIYGENLSIKNLNLETGLLNVTGFVTEIKYSTQQSTKSFIKRLFK